MWVGLSQVRGLAWDSAPLRTATPRSPGRDSWTRLTRAPWTPTILDMPRVGSLRDDGGCGLEEGQLGSDSFGVHIQSRSYESGDLAHFDPGNWQWRFLRNQFSVVLSAGLFSSGLCFHDSVPGFLSP